MSGAHLTRLAITQLVADDLEPEDRRRAEAHLAACAACFQVYQEARQKGAGFASRRGRRMANDPAPNFFGRLARSLGGGGLRPAIAGIIVIASALAVMRQVTRTQAGGDASDRGGARYQLFVNGRASASDTVSTGTGDTLRLGIASSDPVHFAVYYQDDGGPLQPYFPPGGDPAGRPDVQNLPNSLILEGGWREKILYCVWSREPLDAAEAQEAAARADGRDLSPKGGPAVRRFVLRNRAP